MKTTRQRLRVVKDNMMSRCYNPNNPKYKNYGGRGVTVQNEWHTLQGFVKGVTRLSSWDEEAFLRGELQLDKDTKVQGAKIYSKDTCQWISPQDNSQVKPSYQKPFVAINVDGSKYHFQSLQEMCNFQFDKENSWSKPGAIHVLTNKTPYHNRWYFYYVGANPSYPKVICAKNGVQEYRSFRASEVEQKINASSGTVNKKLKSGELYKKEWSISCISLLDLVKA